MKTELKRHETQDAATRRELADLKIHTMALTQAVMGILKNLPAMAAQGRAAPPRPPMGPPGGMPPRPPMAGPPGAGGPPGQGAIPPAILAKVAQLAAARRAQGAQAPQMGQPTPPPGMAMGGLQMGLNRLEPTGLFNRSIAHGMTPTRLNFHAPHVGSTHHFAMGGMPGMARPAVNPAVLAALAQRYGMR